MLFVVIDVKRVAEALSDILDSSKPLRFEELHEEKKEPLQRNTQPQVPSANAHQESTAKKIGSKLNTGILTRKAQKGSWTQMKLCHSVMLV